MSDDRTARAFLAVWFGETPGDRGNQHVANVPNGNVATLVTGAEREASPREVIGAAMRRLKELHERRVAEKRQDAQ